MSSQQGASANDPVVERVRALLELVQRHQLAEIVVEEGTFRLEARGPQSSPASGPVASALAPPPAVEAPARAEPEGVFVLAPMIGTFYGAPAPGEPAFVNVGDQIEIGQTVAIIEAMKIMNEIQAEQAGQVVEVLARNGQGVEFGQPLFRLKQ